MEVLETVTTITVVGLLDLTLDGAMCHVVLQTEITNLNRASHINESTHLQKIGKGQNELFSYSMKPRELM